MNVNETARNLGYMALLIAGGVVIYIVQHECVRVGFDAALSAYHYLQTEFG